MEGLVIACAAEANEGGRKKMYKQAGKDASEIQKTAKDRTLVSQRQHRERLLTRKRLKVETLLEGDQKLSTEEEHAQVQHAIHMLKSGKKEEALTILHRCFARDPNNAETFLRNEGLPLLQKCLLSTDSNLLHAAAWCAVNLSATADFHLIDRVMHLSPLLIQFLPGSDVTMQELCAWAIGNLSGGSQSCKETLLHQGVIPHLINLISSSHLITAHARTKSVLFALINLARDTSYECIRQETFTWHGHQYEIVLYLAVEKLTLLSQLADSPWKEQVMIPYLVVCGNMMAISPDVALLASDLTTFVPCMSSCLSCQSHSVQVEALWVLANFSAEVSCRVLMACHPDLLPKICSLCTSNDSQIWEQLMYIFEALSRVSGLVNKVLVKRGVLDSLSLVLAQPLHSSHVLLDRVLGVVEDLLQECHPEQVYSALKDSLEAIISVSFHDSLVARARTLMQALV